MKFSQKCIVAISEVLSKRISEESSRKISVGKVIEIVGRIYEATCGRFSRKILKKFQRMFSKESLKDFLINP